MRGQALIPGHHRARRQARVAPKLAAFAAAVLAGCSVTSGPDEIAIEHFAEYPGVATLLAEQHCAKFGKQAKLVQMGAQDAYGIGIRKRVSVYHCIDSAAGAGQTKAKP
ncbi:MAG: hypothetical protein ACREB6_16615 [Rhodospirillales bacterium]